MIIKRAQFQILKTANKIVDLGIEEKKAKIDKSSIIEEKNPRYVYFWAKALTADSENSNGDYFSLDELKKSYKTFAGKNLFLDHDSRSVRNAVGVILDVYLIQDDEDETWGVYCLGRIDREAEPSIATKVEGRTLHTVSMGANVGEARCSICDRIMHNELDFCPHMEYLGRKDPETGKKVISYNSDVTFTELSFVANPADTTAEVKEIIAQKKVDISLSKEANRVVENIKDVLNKITALDYLNLRDFIVKEADEKVENDMKNDVTNAKTKNISLKGYVENRYKTKEQKEGLEKERLLARIALSIAESREKHGPEKAGPKSKGEAKMELKAIFVPKGTIRDSKWLVIDRQSKKILMRAELGALFGKDIYRHVRYAKTQLGTDLMDVLEKVGSIGDLKKEDVIKVVVEKAAAYKPSYPSQKYMVTPPVSSHKKVKTGPKVETDKVVTAEESKTIVKEAVKGGDSEVAVGPTEVPTAQPKSQQDLSSHPKNKTKVKTETDDEVVAEEKKDIEKVAEPSKKDTLKAASAFDKMTEPLSIGDGVTAVKDVKSKQIIVKDKEGKEVKKLPDGFGDDVASVVSLIKEIVGAPKAVPKPEGKPVEKPKVVPEKIEKEVKPPEKEIKTEQVSDISTEERKVRQELSEMKLKEALRVKTEKCADLVKKQVEKGLLKIKQEDITEAMKTGKSLLDAKKLAFGKAVDEQIRNLLKMDDLSIEAFEQSIDSVASLKPIEEKKGSLDQPLSLSSENRPEDHLSMSRDWPWGSKRYE